MAGTSAATAGGATVTSAAAGGGGGTAAGPAGTFIGAAVGLVVGLAIDWWMTERFEAKLREQLKAMVDEIEASVFEGAQGELGLRLSLSQTCDVLRDTYRSAVFELVVPEDAR
jgi:hypothetical protein